MTKAIPSSPSFPLSKRQRLARRGGAGRSGALDARRPQGAARSRHLRLRRACLARGARARGLEGRARIRGQARRQAFAEPARHQLAADRAREARQESASPQGRRSLRLRARRRGSAGARQGRREVSRRSGRDGRHRRPCLCGHSGDGARDESRAHPCDRSSRRRGARHRLFRGARRDRRAAHPLHGDEQSRGIAKALDRRRHERRHAARDRERGDDEAPTRSRDEARRTQAPQAKAEGLAAPAIVAIGAIVDLRQALAPFASDPGRQRRRPNRRREERA